MTLRLSSWAIACVLPLAMAGAVMAGQRSPADQALYEKALQDCNSPKWPNGARPLINYAGGWYRCVEPRTK
ncbi:hypothetical protein [Aestuariivirga sp.]|jgi:hypothetical protein|uniref:hypothetical protein n=1 Tax=Aestuariivirga sp. TaxID=2650926 RepID=UPI0037842166